MSIRLKIALLFMLAVIAASGYLKFYWLPQTNQHSEQELSKSVQGHLASISQGLVSPLLQNQLASIHETLRVLSDQNADWLFIVLSDQSGRKLFPLDDVKEPVGESIREFEANIFSHDELLGKISVTVDFAPQMMILHQAHMKLALSLGGGFAIVVLMLAIFVDLTVRRPAEQLARAANQLASGDFEAILPATRRDELGRLVASFATMRDHIRSDKDSLSRARDELEVRVRERTAELQETNEQMLESEGRFRSFIDNAPWSIFLKSLDGRFSFVNPRFQDWFGFNAKDIIGKTSYDIYPKHIADEYTGLDRTVAESGEPIEIELELEFADGIVHTVLSTKFPVTSQDGKLIGIGTINTDVTDLKRAEVDLRASEETLRAIIDHIPSVIYLRDEQARIQVINKAYEKFYGVTQSEALGKSGGEWLGRERAQSFIDRDKKILATGLATDSEIESADSTGVSHHMHSIKFPVLNEQGVVVAVGGIATDVTEKKNLELVRRENEQTNRAISELIPAAYIIQSRGKVVFANALANEIFHAKKGSGLLGINGIDLVEETYIEHILKRRVTVQETGQPSEMERTRHRTLDGRIMETQSIVGPFMWHEEPATINIIVDQTEYARLEEQLRQSQKMEAVGQLTGGIAHEFNNLLMIIVGNLERAMDRVSDSAARKSVSSAMNGAQRAAELTNQMLAFSRKQDLNLESMDMNTLVLDMSEMLERTLGETISVYNELDDGIWPVHADRSLLDSTLLNLALNARDAMPAGGKIVIATSNQTMDSRQLEKHPNVDPGDFVVLKVTDTGQGISPENIEQVFDPFFTTKDVGKGTGLGLSMVLGFVEQSGGFVDLDSQVGKGTSINIFLPRAQGREVSQATSEESDPKEMSVRATVLVVEDQADVREIVVELLSELGCAIIQAEDGETALACIDEHMDIDVLFTDVVLPGGMSGPDIAGVASSKIPGLKVVFTSGYPDGEINQFASVAEQASFIRKPYGRSELAQLFDKVMQT